MSFFLLSQTRTHGSFYSPDYLAKNIFANPGQGCIKKLMILKNKYVLFCAVYHKSLLLHMKLCLHLLSQCKNTVLAEKRARQSDAGVYKYPSRTNNGCTLPCSQSTFCFLDKILPCYSVETFLKKYYFSSIVSISKDILHAFADLRLHHSLSLLLRSAEGYYKSIFFN